MLISAGQPEEDKQQIQQIFEYELAHGNSYRNLKSLCKDVGSRLSGSENAEKAVMWAKNKMMSMDLDSVYLQPVKVPHWVRGDEEYGEILVEGDALPVPIIALGGSIGTGKKGLVASVVEVHSFEELDSMGVEQVQGKIVFFNRPMDPKEVFTFKAYSNAVDQRGGGAIAASKLGAVGVLVRSMTLDIDDHPHTGTMRYEDEVTKIPGAAISTKAADFLSGMLKGAKNVKFYMNMNCETLPDVDSHNVIGEIKGSKYPNEIIVVSGHLDSWDVGEGAHDDGAGCIHAMEVLNIYKQLEITPERTIRCVLYMNEENGSRGGIKYAEDSKSAKEKHIAAIESDAGGFSPRGFSYDGKEIENASFVKRLETWEGILEKYGVHYFEKGWSGADIRHLKDQGPMLFGYIPDSQRYFDYHHAKTDVFEAVDQRELKMGAAAVCALTYLIDKHNVTD